VGNESVFLMRRIVASQRSLLLLLLLAFNFSLLCIRGASPGQREQKLEQERGQEGSSSCTEDGEESMFASSTQTGSGHPEVLRFSTKEDLSQAVGKRMLEAINESKKAKKDGQGIFIALSGGSLPTLLAGGLLQYADQIDFSTHHYFFADERHVPHDHEDSNLLACKKEFLDKVPGVKEEQVYGIDFSVPVEESAIAYEEVLRQVMEANGSDAPSFDVILLGMGPDGHTCSLFPGHPLLEESSRWVAPIKDSPKPPPERITLTYPVLNAAANVFFLAAGKSKEEVIPLTAGLSTQEVISLGSDALPAARVRPNQGNLVWFIDNEAAGKL